MITLKPARWGCRDTLWRDAKRPLRVAVERTCGVRWKWGELA